MAQKKITYAYSFGEIIGMILMATCIPFTIGAIVSVVLLAIIGIFVRMDIDLFMTLWLWGGLLPAIIGLCVSIYTIIQDKKAEPELTMAAFYKECVTQSAPDYDSPANRERIRLIAEKYMPANENSVEEYFRKAKALADQKQDTAEAEKRESDRQAELRKHAKSVKYAELLGREKRMAMLTAAIAEERSYSADNYAEEQKLKKSLRVFQETEKEKDWAVHGGIASAIAGPAAGVAVAADIQRQNAEIRQRNAQRTATFNAMTSHRSSIVSTDWNKVHEYEREREAAKLKLVADMPDQTVFEHLQIETTSMDVSEFGTITVHAKATINQLFTIFEKIPAIVDGTIRADIYCGGTKVGSARMSLPMFGVEDKKTAYFSGMCIGCGEKGKTYTVQYAPHHVWAMER